MGQAEACRRGHRDAYGSRDSDRHRRRFPVRQPLLSRPETQTAADQPAPAADPAEAARVVLQASGDGAIRVKRNPDGSL